MKKTYIKPEMSFESFELSTSVSAGCETKVDYTDQYSCQLYDDATKKWLFWNDCQTNLSAAARSSWCYDVPVDSNQTFTS